MELTYECPACGKVDRVSPVETTDAVTCPGCGKARELAREAIEHEGDAATLRACPWCATEDLYLQKDFPHGLGLGIVVAGFVVSSLFWYDYRPVPALAVLLATALLDVVLYYLVPDVTICYRCLSQARGAGSNPPGRFASFDLAIGERYRQERLRVEQLRRGQARPAP